jgi:plastocyanin
MKRVPMLLAVVLLAGCGSDDGNDRAAGDTTGGGGSVEITATEFEFDPSTVEVDAAGETTFTLVNDGEFPHALEIEGQGIEEETDEIDGGSTTELTVDLEAGEYELYCPVGNHREQGMEGTLVVGGAAGGGGTTTDETETEESTGYAG